MPAGAVPAPAANPDDTVAQLLGHVIAAHARDLMLRQPSAHGNLPDGVHAMRVSARRLRSALATGRPYLDTTLVEPIREELGWLADVLGGARDAEVRSARITEAVDALVRERHDLDWEADLVSPALLAPLDLRHAEALATLRDALEGRRYADLVGRLEAFAADPPWNGRADKHIRTAYRRRVRRELRRIDERMQAATSSALDPSTRTATLHDARRAVKRARYAVEPLKYVYGKRAKGLALRLKKLQSRLGQLQDTVITREYLHHVAHSPDPDVNQSVALVAGALIEREAGDSEVYEAAAMAAWHRVANAKPLR